MRKANHYSMMAIAALAAALIAPGCKQSGGDDTVAQAQYQVTTFAGAKERAIDATGTAARFASPKGVYKDGNFLYVADSGDDGMYSTIRRIDLATGAVTTLAGDPTHFGADGGSVDGIGASACFAGPSGITGDGANLYVADTSNHIIRKVVIATGEVTTIAGAYPVPLNPTGGNADGVGNAARFDGPCGIATDGTYLYVTQPYGRTIRRIEIATGDVITYAGTYTSTFPPEIVDGYRTSAVFQLPTGVVVAGTNLFVSDKACVRRIDLATGMVSTIAGDMVHSGNDDGVGTAARFYTPKGLASDGTRLFVADNDQVFGQTSLVRQIDNITSGSATVTTIAGGINPATGNYIGWSNGTGSSAFFFAPEFVAADGTSLYVSDTGNNSIRKIDISTRRVTTLAGHLDQDGRGADAYFDYPDGIAADGTDLYVSSSKTLRRIGPDGDVTTFAGSIANYHSSVNDATGTRAGFYAPGKVLHDGDFLYMLDYYSEWNIRKIDLATAEVSGTSTFSITPAGAINNARGITSDDDYFYVTRECSIIRIAKSDLSATTFAGDTSGYQDGDISIARFEDLEGIVYYRNALYVADGLSRRIRKVDLSTNQVSTLAGSGDHGIVDGNGVLASFEQPLCLACDGGILYVAEYSCIRKIDLATAEVTTIAGSGAHGCRNEVGKQASFFHISGIAVLGNALYVTEIQNDVVRRIQL